MKRILILTYVTVLFSLLSSCIVIVRPGGGNPQSPEKIPEFTQENILLGENSALRNVFDVHYYDLSVEVIPDKKSLKGTVIMHATAIRDIKKLQIDLHSNFEITTLIDEETGTTLDYQRQERAVYVDINKKQGANFILKIDYQGKPIKAKKAPWLGGFVWKKDGKRNPWIGVACESAGASIWWPLKDHTSDEPDSMRMHYKVPKTLMAIGNGQLESVDTMNNHNVYNWFVSYPINSYNVTIYVGAFKKIEDSYIGISEKQLLINHYVLEENYQKAVEHFKQLKSILNVYENKFGEYPFYRDGFKLIESPYAGMEHQTAIAYGNEYKNDLFGKVDYIMLHETAHEWWGNSVTAGDFADIWLQEGFATYSEVVFLEEEYGVELALKHLKRFSWSITNKHPLVGIQDRRWFHYREHSDAYVKGAWVLHTLRQQIDNDTLFFDILKAFASENSCQIVNSNNFIDLVNKKCNDDFGWYFNQYLYKREWPRMDYMITDDGKLYYRWGNVADEFNKLNVKLQFESDQITIKPSNEVQVISLPKLTSGKKIYGLVGNVLCYFRVDDSLLEK